MPKYYCEYCDIYLTHSSAGGRRQHNSGRKHINNKIEYYTALIREKNLAPPVYPVPAHLQGAVRPGMMGRPPVPGLGGLGHMGLPGASPYSHGSFPGAPSMMGSLGPPPGVPPSALKPGLSLLGGAGPLMRPPVIRAPSVNGNGPMGGVGGTLPPQPPKLPPNAFAGKNSKGDNKGFDRDFGGKRDFKGGDDFDRKGDIKGGDFKGDRKGDFKGKGFGGKDFKGDSFKGSDKGKGFGGKDFDRRSQGSDFKGDRDFKGDFKGKSSGKDFGKKGGDFKGKGKW
eukprot:GEMP01028792.1.p1 GENE.GEMP01028792.1~~GEMP01028792.1.p1  ORF type:complete len:282 (+),score=54.63 GEMP01028792.1:119-964(+)